LERGLPKGVTVDAVEGINTFDDVLGALRDFYTYPREYSSLIIDTVDALEALLIEHVCIKNGWKTIESPAYGKGFVIADAEWQRFTRAITAIRDKHGMAVIMTCHAEVVNVNDPRAPSYSSYQPKLHRRGRGLVMDACDAVFFLAEDLRIVTDDNDRVRASAGPTRHLFAEGSPSYAAKNRWGMPAKTPIPVDFDFGELARFWA
jgi:AAA domain